MSARLLTREELAALKKLYESSIRPDAVKGFRFITVGSIAETYEADLAFKAHVHLDCPTSGDAMMHDLIEAGRWLFKSIVNCDTEALKRMVKIVKARPGTDGMKALSPARLGLPSSKGRPRSMTSLDNWVPVGFSYEIERCLIEGRRLSRSRIMNRLRRTGASFGFTISTGELSEWITHYGLAPFMKGKKPGPKKGTRPRHRVKR